jgi:hypothetical protein
MRKKNSNWYYCNMCETPSRSKEEDGLCINCHLYLCLKEIKQCDRCSNIHDWLDLLIDEQKKNKES